MSVKYVDFCLRTKLSCSLILNAEVILCLKTDALLKPSECPEGADETYIGPYVDATICQYWNTGDCGGVHHYRFAYNDEVLADISVPLQSSDILGATCRDCLVNYLEYKAGDEVKIVTEGEVQTLVSQHGCEYVLAAGGAPLLVSDTDSVNLTIGPTLQQTLSADVKISADPDNIIDVVSDGLLVEATNVPILVLDTSTVDLSVSGSPQQTVSAAVKISANPNNIITAQADGLWASINSNSGKMLKVSPFTHVWTPPGPAVWVPANFSFIPSVSGDFLVSTTLDWRLDFNVGLLDTDVMGVRARLVDSATSTLLVQFTLTNVRGLAYPNNAFIAGTCCDSRILTLIGGNQVDLEILHFSGTSSSLFTLGSIASTFPSAISWLQVG